MIVRYVGETEQEARLPEDGVSLFWDVTLGGLVADRAAQEEGMTLELVEDDF